MASTFTDYFAWLVSLAERVPGFLTRSAIAEWPFLAALGLALTCAMVADFRRGVSLRAKYGGKGARIDLLYAALELTHVQAILVLAPVAAGLNALVDAYAPGLRLGVIAEAPWWVTMPAAFVIADFCAYWLHRAKHWSPWLWQFHKVHHSQDEMTVFTRFRFPLLDRLLSMIVLLLPVSVVTGSVSFPVVFLFLVALRSCLEHSGHEWTYGPLGKILVSPQYHGIHHSTARAHRDANFAGFLTVWDWLFGTQAERGDQPLAFGLPEEKGANTLLYGATATVRGLYGLARERFGRPEEVLKLDAERR